MFLIAANIDLRIASTRGGGEDDCFRNPLRKLSFCSSERVCIIYNTVCNEVIYIITMNYKRYIRCVK